MADALRTTARHVLILAYLRDPLGYVTSAFQQQVRGGQSCCTLPRPHYRARFQKFLASFGPDAVSFRAYAPARFHRNSVTADYAIAAGLPPDAVAVCQANTALPLDALRLVHLLNRSTRPARSSAELSARSGLIALLATRFSDRFVLPAEIAASAIDPDEVAWMEDLSHIALGPRYSPSDPIKAEAALGALLCAIPAEAHETLRAELSARHLPHSGTDDPATLLKALYESFLHNEQQRQPNPLRSASA